MASRVMGGEMSVESRPGQGSTFRFSAEFPLPLLPADALPSSASDGNYRRDALIVTGDSDHAKTIAAVLADMGVHCKVLDDGAEGTDEGNSGADHSEGLLPYLAQGADIELFIER